MWRRWGTRTRRCRLRERGEVRSEKGSGRGVGELGGREAVGGDDAGEEGAFGGVDFGAEGGWGFVRGDGDGFLGEDGVGAVGGDEVGGATGGVGVRGEGVGDGVRAREIREEGRVDIEDPVGEGGGDGVFETAAEAGAEDPVGLGGAETVGEFLEGGWGELAGERAGFDGEGGDVACGGLGEDPGGGVV